MNIYRLGRQILTVHQAMSYFLIKYCDTDYIEYLGYDYYDWLDWAWINRN